MEYGTTDRTTGRPIRGSTEAFLVSCTDDRYTPVETGSGPSLECLYDDPVDPSELTVFSPRDDRLATEWMTVDLATAIPIDRMR